MPTINIIGNFILNIKPGLFRLLLATLVVFYHITDFIFLGGFAVHSFFILSGYWISKMYLEKYSSSVSNSGVVVRNQNLSLSNSYKNITIFYLSRVLRIFPVYWLVTVFVYCVKLLFEPSYLQELLAYSIRDWLMLFGIIGFNLKGFLLVPAWSLDIELQFYILAPFLISLASKGNKVLYFLLFVSVLSMIVGEFFANEVLLNKTLLGFLPYFLLGIFLYLVKPVFDRKVILLGVSLFIIVIALHFVFPSLKALVTLKPQPNYVHILNMLLPILIIPFISRNVEVVSNRLDQKLGNVSYTLYLMHWVTLIPYSHYFGHLAFLQRLPFALLYLVVTFCISYLITHYFDEPLEKIRRKLVSKYSQKIQFSK